MSARNLLLHSGQLLVDSGAVTIFLFSIISAPSCFNYHSSSLAIYQAVIYYCFKSSKQKGVMMSKQVPMIDEVDDALNSIVKARSLKTPHRTVTKKEVVADLIMRAVKRECK